MTDEEKEFIKKVNIDKANNTTKISIILIIISILTYVIPLVFGEFDFGIVFEIASLIFLLISKSYMGKYDETRAKRYLICSMIPIGWILIYDFIILLSAIAYGMDIIIVGYGFFRGELLSILYMLLLFAINKDLAKADNPIKYKESTDWFYEKYDANENGGNKNDG